MEKVVIIINAEVSEQGQIISASPVTQKMVEAMQHSINRFSAPSTEVEIISAATLWSKQSRNFHKSQDSGAIYCPLTIQLPDYFDFPQKRIYSACKDINARRKWVEKKLGFKTSVGDSWLGHLWLPIILTTEGGQAQALPSQGRERLTKSDRSIGSQSDRDRRYTAPVLANKPIYAEIIGEGSMPNSYEQPIDIPSRQRKLLHSLADELLDSLDAPPATYLLQFSIYKGEIVFDRLWPFPAAPALITLKTQQPDLFTCHWHCLKAQPIPDINISDAMPI